MTPLQAAQDVAVQFRGRSLDDEGFALAKAWLPEGLFPSWLSELMQKFAIIDVTFSMPDAMDISGLGGEMFWLDPKQIVSEATESQPGKAVLAFGFLPFGGCLEGSGDPYFLDMRGGEENPRVVRVPHDYATVAPYPIEKIELVALSLADFFQNTVVGEPLRRSSRKN